MIDHVSLAVRDIKAADAFYNAVLAPLGLTKLREWPNAAIGYGKKYPEFWINHRADMLIAAQPPGRSRKSFITPASFSMPISTRQVSTMSATVW